MRRVLAASIALLALTGCGTSDDKVQARHAAERFYAAVAAQDGTAACAALSQDAAKSIEPCGRAVKQLQLHGGRVVSTRVYVTNAIVEFSGGDVAFLGREPTGWKVDAAGCRFDQGKPRDRPADCEVKS